MLKSVSFAGCFLIAAALAAAGPQVTDPRLKIELFAESPQIVTPIGIAVDGKGRVFVVESHTHQRPADYQGPKTDRIRMIEDTKGTGRADRITTFFEGTNSTMCLAFDPHGALYVATRMEVFRLRDTKGTGTADERTRIAHLETTGTYPHDGLEGMAFDSNGDLFIGMGENLGAAYKLIGSDGSSVSGGGEGGNFFRCKPDGSRVERFATGFWNPFQCCFDQYGRLFTVDNDPDSRPPCRLLHVVEGGDYGFRFRYGRKGTHPFVAWNGELPGTLPMASAVGEAPAGLICYDSVDLPSSYQGKLMATSWGDHRIDCFELSDHGATAWAKMTPLVTGGDDFRPVSIAVAPDGSLYVTDWVSKAYEVHGKGRIWHVSAAQPIQATRNDEKNTKEGIALLAAGLQNPKANLDASDQPPALRAMAVRLISEDEFDPLQFMESSRPIAVRAGALRRAKTPAIRDVALQSLDDPDPFLQQAARQALQHIVGELNDLDVPNLPTARQRVGVMLVLRAANEPAGRKFLPDLLKDSDSAVRFAAIEWVGEERIKHLRPQIAEMLKGEANTRELFNACVAALELLDGTQRPDEFHGESYAAKVLGDDQSSDAMRRLALRMLSPDHPALSIERLKGYLDSPDAALKLEAIKALRASPLPERFAVLADVARNAKRPADARAEAIVGLAESASQRELLLTLATSGEPAVRSEALRSLRGPALAPAEIEQLEKLPAKDAGTRELIERLLAPPAPSNPPRHDVDVWLKALDGPGDPEAGERIFFHPRAAGCYRCHEMNGRGGQIGPDLTTAARLLGRRKLVESIVDPSKEIAPRFVPWTLVMKDGRTLTGLLVTEGPGDLETYSDNAGKLFTLKPADIAERNPLHISIMPEGLADALTTQEFRDLLAFLMAQ
ncbi:MAG TPA: PVC-type heme-binding CxxCH protein [Pirellulales bacterium]|nr:PVC-type heme-binding CxxCH protein [Pirellulales bacterium]